MLLEFLNNLYKKPIDYQLFWLFILGQTKNNEIVNIPIKTIKDKFNYPKYKFYRILNFGLPYFNNKNGVFLLFENQSIQIQVIRTKNNVNAKKHPKSDYTNKVIEIISYLNEKTNKNYHVKSQGTIRLINARLKEGFNVDDFKLVIDKKCNKWLNSSFEPYLRPQTLFGTKMESYINEPDKIIKNNERFSKTQSAVDKAKQINWFNKE